VRPHGLESLPETPGTASFLPIFAALGGETTVQRPGTGENDQSLERKMESRRATPEQRRERTELDARFGTVGIPAVAAALRYQSNTKNPAYAPAVLRETREAEEAVA
jgi:hypothetical protein